jgi:8-oxo-dGTP diphosphatase
MHDERADDEPTIACAGAVVRDDSGRLLVVLRGRPPQAGRWALPGGRCEAGESTAATAAREVREETGLTVAVGDALGSVRIGRYRVTDHLADVVGGALHPGDDADDARFVTEDELRALPCTDGLLDQLRRWGQIG